MPLMPVYWALGSALHIHANLLGTRLFEFQCEAGGKSLAKKMIFLSELCVMQNKQCTLSHACIFKFMSLFIHQKKVKLEYQVQMNMTNMQNMHLHFTDGHGALTLQVGVGLTQMAATPCRQWLFCSGTLCGPGYGGSGWFSPSTRQRSGQYVHPVGVVPVTTRSE